MKRNNNDVSNCPGPWKQYRDLNIYVNPVGDVKYKKGNKEHLFKKVGFTSRSNKIVQNVIYSKTGRYYIKRLVWECYKGKIPEGYAIVHKCSNLCDSLHNLQIISTKDYCKKVNGSYKKKFVLDYDHNRRFRGAQAAADFLGIANCTVIRYCNHKVESPAYHLEWGGLVSGKDC